MKQKTWFALDISVDTNAVEAIEFALNELDSAGTEIEVRGLNQIIENTTVIGCFEEKPTDKIVDENLAEALRIYGFDKSAIKQMSWREVENKDWLAEWKKSWKPTETSQFVIAPVWSEVITDKHLMRIEPSMAFGTGTHETTKLCLKAIEDYYENGETFFDVGTGTGILAIAVAMIQGKSKKAKGKISGCDTDEDSVKIAIENAEINNVDKFCKFYIGSISEDSDEFDFVCANVTADVIIPMLPLLLAKAKRKLVLSGILVEQKQSVLNELAKFGITKTKTETDGEWISIFVETERRRPDGKPRRGDFKRF
jgi:ribosomal protein L11 methyltransferase